MFRSSLGQEKEWGSSWAQVGPSQGHHMLLSLAVGTGAGPQRHVSPSCAHPQQCQAHESARTHTHTHAHAHARSCINTKVTPTNTLTASMAKPPPPGHSPLQLSESFTRRSQAWKTPLLPGPHLLQACLSPTMSGPVGLSYPEAPACGAGEGPAVNPPPSPPLPWDLSHTKPGASHPPVGPSSQSLKAGVVWEEFRHGGGGGGGQKRKEERR